MVSLHHESAQSCPCSAGSRVGAMAVVARICQSRKFLDFIWGNITLGQKASLYWAIGAGRFLQTAGLFLLGLYIGRKELFIYKRNTPAFWVKVLIIAAIFLSLVFLKRTDPWQATMP